MLNLYLPHLMQSSTQSSARVYDSYDIDNPPAHPGAAWTRFVCISDTHSRRTPVPPGDVLLHGGDLSSWGRVQNLEKTITWLASLPHPYKMCVFRVCSSLSNLTISPRIIAGNHDVR